MKIRYLTAFFLIPFIISSCDSKTERSDFNSDLVNLVVKYADGKASQIFIPFDGDKELSETEIKSTQPVLVEKLQQAGFKIVESKYEGFGSECASLKVKLRNEKCNCTVFRMYEYTKMEGRYRIRENIDRKKNL